MSRIHFIEQQNSLFCDFLSHFSKSMKVGEAKDEIARVIRFLDLHVHKYFPREEAFITENSYEGADFHIAQHKKFKTDFESIKSQYAANGYSVSIAISLQRIMQDWVSEHIQKTDKILCDYILSAS